MSIIRKLGVGLIASGLVSGVFLPKANAELVYEEQTQAAPNQAGAARVDERTTLRQAIGASEKAQATLQNQASVPTAPAPVVVVTQPAPVAAAVPTGAAAATEVQVGQARVIPESTETQNLSKSELLRRERVRAELKNEDLLQERLEELRLRDEKKRTDQVFSAQAAQEASGPAETQAVVAPVTEHPGAAAQVPAGAVVAQPVAVSTSAVSDSSNSDKTTLTIRPHAGIGQMQAQDYYYSVTPHFSTGLSLGIVASDNLSFEVGYTYSEYGISLAQNSPYISYLTGMGYGYYNPANNQTVALKQNLIEAGLKLHFTGQDSKIRPFIVGGGGYSIGYLNYNQTILNQLNVNPALRAMGSDYQTNSYLGYIGGGLDFRINKSLSIGADFRYYAVLSSNQTNQINNAALYGYPAYGYNYYASLDPSKQYVGGSLSSVGFYMIQGGATFTF